MSKTTAATLALARVGVQFTPYPYDYDPDAPKVGLQAAAALGVSPDQVFKTLVVVADDELIVAVVPVSFAQ